MTALWKKRNKMFNSKITEEKDYLVLELKGDLDVYSEDEFRSFVEENLTGIDKDLVIDLKDLDYLDSTGLGLFMKAYKILDEKGLGFKIINPKENIYKLFKITDLLGIFNME